MFPYGIPMDRRKEQSAVEEKKKGIAQPGIFVYATERKGKIIFCRGAEKKKRQGKI